MCSNHSLHSRFLQTIRLYIGDFTCMLVNRFLANKEEYVIVFSVKVTD